MDQVLSKTQNNWKPLIWLVETDINKTILEKNVSWHSNTYDPTILLLQIYITEMSGYGHQKWQENFYSTFIYKSTKLKTAQMFISNKMGK